MNIESNLRKNPHYAQGIQKRTKAVNSYNESHLLPYMKTFTGYDSLKAGALNYNLVLVGSDQVWLPLGLYTKFFNLLFVDDSICKMA